MKRPAGKLEDGIKRLRPLFSDVQSNSRVFGELGKPLGEPSAASSSQTDAEAGQCVCVCACGLLALSSYMRGLCCASLQLSLMVHGSL